MKKILYLFAIFCTSQIVYSQSDFREGFIINHNHDTISGLINYREGDRNYRYCQYKGSDNQNIVLYKADDIIGYGFKNDKYFESKIVETSVDSSEVVLLEVLISGMVSLYKYENVFYIEKSESGLLKLSNETIESIINGETRTRQSNSYLRTLNLLLSDCTEISSRIPRTTLSERSLTDVVEIYNKCMKAPAIIYKQNKPWIHSRFGIAGGLVSYHIGFETINNFYDHLGPFKRSNSPLVGVSFDILSPRINERVSFNTNFLFSKSLFNSYNEENLFNKITKNYVTIEMTHLKIPIGLKYTFHGNKLSSFVNFGISETFTLNSGSEWTQTYEYYTVFDTYHNEALEINKNQFGMWGGAGISKSISKGLNIYIELRYEKSDGINAEDFIAITKSNVTSVQFIIGIAIK